MKIIWDENSALPPSTPAIDPPEENKAEDEKEEEQTWKAFLANDNSTQPLWD